MITLCVPTRGRPDLFKRMLSSAKETATHPLNVEVIAVMDKDDETKNRYPRKGVRKLVGERPENMAGLWDWAAREAAGDIVGLLGDDAVFLSPGWDEAIETEFANVPDEILMVYTESGLDPRPIMPFVSKKWVELAGFTPDDYQGWFADEWIWAIAAEVGRVVHLPHVVIEHRQFEKPDQTYMDGQMRRLYQGGLDGMRRRFYSTGEVARRDDLVARLRGAMDTGLTILPSPPPPWLSETLALNASGRVKTRNEGLLVTVHCYKGDSWRVKEWLPLYLHHGRPVLVMSPEDSPVTIEHPQVQNYHGGPKAYTGQKSLDRQRDHLEHLLTLPYEWFFMNDADSVCLSPDLPDFLFEDRNVLWALYAKEWRPHTSPYPKIGLHPPYFAHKSAIRKMLTAADNPEVLAHPETPFIDWYMLALAHESGVETRNYPEKLGFTFPAWRYKRGSIPDNKEMEDEHEQFLRYDDDGDVRGDDIMADRVHAGAIFLHSIKHPHVMDRLNKIAEARRVALGDGQLISILVPFTPERNDHQRSEVWKWIRSRWSALVPGAEIVMGTDPDTPPGPYSKTAAVNDAYRKARGDVFIVVDADSWMEPDAVYRAVDVARKTNRLVVPWKLVLRLDEQQSRDLLDTDPTATLEITDAMRATAFAGPDPITAGTLYVITRKAFEEVEGMDPRFRGWGMEDVAFSRACQTLLGQTIYGYEEVISLYHTRPSLPKRGRIWEGEEQDVPVDQHPNIELAKKYDGAVHDARIMRLVVNEHPLKNARIPLEDSMDTLRQVINPDAVVYVQDEGFFDDQSWRIPIETIVFDGADDPGAETITVEIREY